MAWAEQAWAKQVIQGLSGSRKSIPFDEINTDLPDVLEISHIETLLTHGASNYWITKEDNIGSVLLVMGNKTEQKLLVTEFMKEMLEIDGIHDWHKHRDFGKQDTEADRKNILAGIEAIKETLTSTSVKSVTKVLDTFFKETESYPNIFHIASNYPDYAKAKVKEMVAVLKEVETRKGPMCTKHGHVCSKTYEDYADELQEKVASLTKDYKTLVEQLRDDAVIAVLAAKTVKTLPSSDADSLEATAIETSIYANRDSFSSEFAGVDPITQAANREELEATSESLVALGQGDVPIPGTSLSTASVGMDPSAPSHDPNPSIPAASPPTLASLSKKQTPSIEGNLLELIQNRPKLPADTTPIQQNLAIDHGTYKVTSPVAAMLTIQTDKARWAEQYDKGGTSSDDAPDDIKNMFALALLKIENIIYIVLIQPTKLGNKKLVNIVTLYEKHKSLPLKRIVRFDQHSDFKPNVNPLAKLVGQSKINANFARLLKFTADRLLLANLLNDEPSKLIIYTNDTFAAYSLLLVRMLKYDKPSDTTTTSDHAIQTILTTMGTDKCIIRAGLYDDDELTLQEIESTTQASNLKRQLKALIQKQEDAAAKAARAKVKAAEAEAKAAEAAEAAAAEKAGSDAKTRADSKVNSIIKNGIIKARIGPKDKKLHQSIVNKLIQELRNRYEELLVPVYKANPSLKRGIETVDDPDDKFILQVINQAINQAASSSSSNSSATVKKSRQGGGKKNTYKNKINTKKSRKVNKSRKSRKPKKSRKQSHYKSLFGKTLKRHTKTI